MANRYMREIQFPRSRIREFCQHAGWLHGKKAETRAGVKRLASLFWIGCCDSRGRVSGTRPQLLITLSLLELVKADAIKVVQLFIVICDKGSNEQRKALADYVAKFPRLSRRGHPQYAEHFVSVPRYEEACDYR